MVLEKQLTYFTIYGKPFCDVRTFFKNYKCGYKRKKQKRNNSWNVKSIQIIEAKYKTNFPDFSRCPK